jgi:hypothetical protein
MFVSPGWRQLSILTPPGGIPRHLTSGGRWRMAERKGHRKVPPRGRQSGKEMSEKSPNPHGESKILQMPIRTQQRNETSGKNIPKVPNTVGGNLNPSVAHDFERHVVSPKNIEVKRPRPAKPVKDIKRKDA